MGAESRNIARDIARRVQECLEEGRVPSARQWAIRAGLDPSFISVAKRRVALSENAGFGGAEELTSLARAAGVTAHWLITGEGPKEAAPTRFPEADERYPERGEAVEIARRLGYRHDAIARVQGLALQEPDRRPTVRDWLEYIQAEDRRMSDPFGINSGQALSREDADATRPARPTSRGRRSK